MKPFSILIKPSSADCNLCCEYCFYRDRGSLYPATRQHKMSDEVLTRMIRSYMATYQPHYSFAWQGGEPTLMGRDFFQRVTALQARHGRRGALVNNGLQTNATLIDSELANHLARYRFLVGVSLDGPAEMHNRFRQYPNGRGSYADVVRGIKTLNRHRVPVNVVTLVNAANVAHPIKVYEHLCDLGFVYHQYVECVEYDETGQLRPYAITGQQWGDFLCALYDRWIHYDTERISIRLFDSIVSLMVENQATICQMGTDCRHYFIVEHNGDVYPCDFFVERKWKLGNIRDSTWKKLAESSIYKQFGEQKRNWNEACATCPYLRYCAGDCIKNRLPLGNRKRPLSQLCSGWKQFYAHALPGLNQLALEILGNMHQNRNQS